MSAELIVNETTKPVRPGALKYIPESRQGLIAELWAVVNNAGVAVFAEAEWCPLTQYETVMGINWLGTVRVTKAFLPLVRAARGRVINLSSMAGRVALPGFTAYSSSKFALIGFSDSLRREMVKFGVQVITIEPSLYRTAIADREALTRQNVQMWAIASQEVRQHYGDTYFRAYLAKLVKMLRGFASKNLGEVVDDLVHAVTSVLPYRRYVPALFTWQIPAYCFSACPVSLQDSVLTRQMRVPATPAVLTRQMRVPATPAVLAKGGELNGKKSL